MRKVVTMKRQLSGLAVLAVALCWASSAQAQMMTERYIPIGQSPGISGKYSYTGQIESLDTSNRTVTVRGEQGSRTIKVTEKTWIWLDRSQQRQPNVRGVMSDLQPGRRVEIKYTDYQTKDTAHWIKVAQGSG